MRVHKSKQLRTLESECEYAAQRRGWRGFTLVELVVVILIIGTTAAASAPKAFNASDSARDESAENSLNVIRDALELYRADNNDYPDVPDEVDFKAELDPYLRNAQFPVCPVGHQNGTVRVSTAGSPLNPSGSAGWAYDKFTGEFIINHTSYSNW